MNESLKFPRDKSTNTDLVAIHNKTLDLVGKQLCVSAMPGKAKITLNNLSRI